MVPSSEVYFMDISEMDRNSLDKAAIPKKKIFSENKYSHQALTKFKSNLVFSKERKSEDQPAIIVDV